MNKHVHKHEKINYLEFPAKDIATTKKFSPPSSTDRSPIMSLIILLSQMQVLMAVFINPI